METGWIENDGAIEKEFSFSAYLQGVNFAVRAAETAERMDHHPDILILHKKVRITSTTHDEGGVVTGKDRKLAGEIDAIYKVITGGE